MSQNRLCMAYSLTENLSVNRQWVVYFTAVLQQHSLGNLLGLLFYRDSSQPKAQTGIGAGWHADSPLAAVRAVFKE